MELVSPEHELPERAKGAPLPRKCCCVIGTGVPELNSKVALEFWSCPFTPVDQDTARWSGKGQDEARSEDGLLVCASGQSD